MDRECWWPDHLLELPVGTATIISCQRDSIVSPKGSQTVLGKSGRK